MDHLLVATDLSGRADRALARAALLACERGGRLTVLHVLPTVDTLRERGGAVERELAARLAAAGVPEAGVAVSVGEKAGEIGRQAERLGADAIVIGTHGPDAPADLIRGATAERLCRVAGVPILVVGTPPAAAYRRVVVGVDAEGCARGAASLAGRLADGGTVRLVHAFEAAFAEARAEMRRVGEAGLERVASDLARYDVAVEMVARRGAVATVLRDEIRRSGAELLALGTHARRGVAHAFLGSVAEVLLRDPPCDLLVVRAGTADRQRGGR